MFHVIDYNSLLRGFCFTQHVTDFFYSKITPLIFSQN